METGDAADLLHAESDLTYAKLGQDQPAILRNQVAFHAHGRGSRYAKRQVPVSTQIKGRDLRSSNRRLSSQIGQTGSRAFQRFAADRDVVLMHRFGIVSDQGLGHRRRNTGLV